jgi:hypothetical protein
MPEAHTRKERQPTLRLDPYVRGTVVAVAVVAAGAGVWRSWRGVQASAPRPVPAAITTWRGGQLLACMVTVNGASLMAFRRDYRVVMLCGTGRDDRDRLSDRAITVSDAFAIDPHDFVIEEAVSGPMRVLLADLAAKASRPTPDPGRLHEEALWYELALLPESVNPLAVDTVADVERLGGRRLLTGPRWTVIAIRP